MILSQTADEGEKTDKSLSITSGKTAISFSKKLQGCFYRKEQRITIYKYFKVKEPAVTCNNRSDRRGETPWKRIETASYIQHNISYDLGWPSPSPPLYIGPSLLLLLFLPLPLMSSNVPSMSPSPAPPHRQSTIFPTVF